MYINPQTIRPPLDKLIDRRTHYTNYLRRRRERGSSLKPMVLTVEAIQMIDLYFRLSSPSYTMTLCLLDSTISSSKLSG